jgi:hypothetical protein
VVHKRTSSHEYVNGVFRMNLQTPDTHEFQRAVATALSSHAPIARWRHQLDFHSQFTTLPGIPTLAATAWLLIGPSILAAC